MTRHPNAFSWLTDQMPDGPDQDATDRARAALIAHLTAAAAEPAAARRRRGRLLRVPLTLTLLTTTAAAAAAAAIVLIVASAGGGQAGRGSPTGPAGVLNASAVVRRVSARVKELGASYGVTETVGGIHDRAWFYTDPHTGVQYEHDLYGPSVTYASAYWGRQRLLAPKRAQITQLWVDSAQKTWWVTHSVIGVHPSSVPNISDSAQQITQFLRKRDVHLVGKRTVRGQQALKLTRTLHRETIALYVSAVSYRPIEEVMTFFSSHGRVADVDRSYLLPATPANIARAKDPPGHAGDRRGRAQ